MRADYSTYADKLTLTSKAHHCGEQRGFCAERDEAISQYRACQFNPGDCFVAPPALALLLPAMTGFKKAGLTARLLVTLFTALC
jgi:hypothetical protein